MTENHDDHLKRVVRYYEKSKLGYDLVLHGSKHFGFYPETGKISEREAQINMLEKIAENLDLKNKEVILDAGCGQGIVSTYLASKYECKIKGITIVPFEVDKCVELAKKMGVSDKVEYMIMDYSNMNFGDGFFDRIYAIETLSHSSDISKTLRGFYKKLKNNGKIVLFEYALAQDCEFSEYEKNMLDVVIYGSAMAGLKKFRHDDFANTIKEAGFKNINVQDITKNVMPSVERLYRLARISYAFIKIRGTQKNHPNETAAVELYKMAREGLLHYEIFTAEKRE